MIVMETPPETPPQEPEPEEPMPEEPQPDQPDQPDQGTDTPVEVPAEPEVTPGVNGGEEG